MMEKMLYTRADAAKLLSISTDTLDRLSGSGYIKRLKIGSRSYFTPEALAAFLGKLINAGGINPWEVGTC